MKRYVFFLQKSRKGSLFDNVSRARSSTDVYSQRTEQWLSMVHNVTGCGYANRLFKRLLFQTMHYFLPFNLMKGWSKFIQHDTRLHIFFHGTHSCYLRYELTVTLYIFRMLNIISASTFMGFCRVIWNLL